MDNRIKRITMSVSIWEINLGQKNTANNSIIEQTPNARGGHFIVSVAGILTRPSLPHLPSLTTSGKLW